MTLPTDIWADVGAFLDSRDLSQLCLVASPLYCVLRPTLYRNVHLQSGKASTASTCALLTRDTRLAASVRGIHLTTNGWASCFSPDVTWLPIPAFRNMVQLRKLEFTNNPFTKREEQVELSETLSSHCRVKEFGVFMSPTLGVDLRDAFELSLPGLESIVCHHFLKPEKGLLSLFKSSHQTLTSISLPANALTANEIHGVAQLLRMSFPALRSLHIGNVVPWGPDDEQTKFLLNHPTLEELSLESYYPETPSEGLVPSFMEPSMLPNLKCLRGHPLVIVTLLQENIDSLKQLQRLTILSCTSFAPNNMFASMLMDTIDRLGVTFPNMEYLTFPMTTLLTFPLEIMLRWLEILGRVAPNLTYLDVTLGYLQPAQVKLCFDQVAKCFTHLRLLKFKYSTDTFITKEDDQDVMCYAPNDTPFVVLSSHDESHR
ncbi:hypothetical protein AX16_004820 [Volvariella volvacea WC 439]|nr:hypothetical protein AX16_004820 [Volvariella volvacea WC 439]